MKLFVTCLLSLFCTVVSAEFFDDTRVLSVVPTDKPIVVNFLFGQPVMVEFEDKIDNIAVSGLVKNDWHQEWEMVIKERRLFLKALVETATARTVLVTTINGGFVIDLKPPKSSGKGFLSKLVVRNYQKKPLVKAWQDAPPVDKIIGEPKPPPPTPIARVVIVPYRNRHYTMQIVKDNVDIKPREAWDDGKFTYMRFPRNLVLPVIYKSTLGSQEETLVNFHVENDGLVVLHGVSPLWNLRYNDNLIGVFNESFTAEGPALPNQGGVRRVMK